MTTDNRSDIGQIIKQRRIMIPLTRGELSAAGGVSLSYLGRIEKGERFPSAYILRKIAKPLGFEEDELLTLGDFLSSQPSSTGRNEAQFGRLDSVVGMMLSQEPVEVQRAVIGILSILKTIARGLTNSRG